MSKLVNQLKQKLDNGSAVIGTAVTNPSPHLMRTLIDCGFDWLMVDLEHGAIGPETTQAMIAATQGSDCVPLVRLPAGQKWMPKMPLDMGALGLFFPLVMNADEAKCAVQSALYPPSGNRGFGPIHAGYRWQRSMVEYAADADEAILKIIMIEHIDAIKELDDILKVDGVDMVFIAPYDLSQSLGIPGEFNHPLLLQAVKQVEDAVLAAGIDLGGYAGTAEKGQELLQRGYKLLMLAYDNSLIENAITPMVSKLRA